MDEIKITPQDAMACLGALRMRWQFWMDHGNVSEAEYAKGIFNRINTRCGELKWLTDYFNDEYRCVWPNNKPNK